MLATVAVDVFADATSAHVMVLGALALVLAAGWVYADRTGLPGPGLGMLIGHVVAAVAAVVAQVRVDRRTDRLGTFAAAALAAVIVGGLALVWLF